MSDCYSARTLELEALSEYGQTALEVIFALELDAIEDKIIAIKYNTIISLICDIIFIILFWSVYVTTIVKSYSNELAKIRLS